MLRPAVNRQPGFRRGLVEQSNAAKNSPPVGWLADCVLWLAADFPGQPAGCQLAAVWPSARLAGFAVSACLAGQAGRRVDAGWPWLTLAGAS